MSLLVIISFSTWGKNPKHHQHHYQHRSHLIPHLEIDIHKCHAPCKVTFDARKSKISHGSEIKSYFFSFGDGQVLETPDPIVTHIYQNSSVKLIKNGHFKAALRIENKHGKKSKEVFRQIKVYKEKVTNQPPVSSFSFIPTEPKTGDIVTLSSQSTDDKGIASYEWVISDGRILFGEIAGLTFEYSGTYTITHRVIDNEGLSNESSQQVQVLQRNTPPIPSLIWKVTGSGPYEVTLDASGSTDNGSISSYEWYLDDKFLASTNDPIFNYRVIKPNTYNFKVKITDNEQLSSMGTSVVNVEMLPLPEGVFISGVDSIDLNAHSLLEEYYFYVKENHNGEVKSIDGLTINLLTVHPGLTFQDNRLQVIIDDIQTFPERIELIVKVNDIEYTKSILLNKTISKHIGTIPPGELTEYTISNETSEFNGSTISFTQSQSSLESIEVFETELSGGKIALDLKYSGIQPIEYVLLNIPPNFTKALDASNQLHLGILDYASSFYSILQNNYFEKLFKSCSSEPNVYFKHLGENKKVIKQDETSFPLFYAYDDSVDLENIFLNESRITQIIKSSLSYFSNINFVYYFGQDNFLAYASPEVRDTIWVNLKNISDQTDYVIIGSLVHEKAHVEQLNSLGCNEIKLRGTLRSNLLESHAEHETFLSPIPFLKANYSREKTYYETRTLEAVYVEFINTAFNFNGINDHSAYAYLLGNIYDHLNYVALIDKIKQTSVPDMFSHRNSPSGALEMLLGRDEYLNFVSKLTLFNFYPSINYSPYSKFISELFNYNPAVPLPVSFFYIPTATEGSSQKVDVLKPFENKLNIIDFDKFTSSMNEVTKANLRFKFLVYPSEDENLVAGFENVHVALSSKGDVGPSISETLWRGDGTEPMNNEFILDFNKFQSSSTDKQIQVILSNADSEREVPVMTTVIPEIKKQICYMGPSYLKVTFMNKGDGIFSDYNQVIRGVVASGTCEDFYLIYNTGYFYEFLVHTTTPLATGVKTNWSQENYDTSGYGFIFSYRVYDTSPVSITGTLVYLPDGYYRYDLDLNNFSSETIIIH